MTKYVYEVPEPELIELELGGETFQMLPLGGLDWRDFIKEIARPDPDDKAAKLRQEAQQAELVFGIFESHMETAEYERFSKFCRARSLKIDLLLRIIQDVVAGSADLPTQPPSPSGPGRSTTGDTSTGDVSSPDLT